MEKSKLLTIQKIYRVILSLSVAVTGICLIVGCLMIYRFGTGTYSHEAVTKTFSLLAVPICASPVLAIIGFVSEYISPYTDKKQVNKPDNAFLLARMYGRKDISAIGAEIFAEQKKRKTHMLILSAVLFAASIVFLLYACNGSNFDRAAINASVIRAMWVLLPCLAVSFACGVYVLYSREKSLRRELELARQLPNAENKVSQAKKNSKYPSVIRTVLIAVSVLLLGIGLYLGGAADVLTKAINICTECIGLG